MDTEKLSIEAQRFDLCAVPETARTVMEHPEGVLRQSWRLA
ncbi:MAG: hypothetical protein ACLFPG_04460 [Desulfohalobiaceae bacterium]